MSGPQRIAELGMRESVEKLVSVVVLAWNQVDETIECLNSLSKSDYTNMEVLLVDNGSTDGTSQSIQRDFSQVRIIRTNSNVGIARGYNLGIEYSLGHGADYVMVMNNDTVVAPRMISQLVGAMVGHPDIGMVMPKIFYYGNKNLLWSAGASWHPIPPRVTFIGLNSVDGPRFARTAPIEYAPSCCLLISKSALEKVGYFDGGYYFYFDDWDYSTRLRNAGFKILLVAEAHLWHKVSMSTQKTGHPAQWWHTMGRSSVRFYLRHKSWISLAFFSIWIVLRETAKLNGDHVLPFLRGVVQGMADQRSLGAYQIGGNGNG